MVKKIIEKGTYESVACISLCPKVSCVSFFMFMISEQGEGKKVNNEKVLISINVLKMQNFHDNYLSLTEYAD